MRISIIAIKKKKEILEVLVITAYYTKSRRIYKHVWLICILWQMNVLVHGIINNTDDINGWPNFYVNFYCWHTFRNAMTEKVQYFIICSRSRNLVWFHYLRDTKVWSQWTVRCDSQYAIVRRTLTFTIMKDIYVYTRYLAC